MSEYPKTVILEDEDLFALLKEKEELVLNGREMSLEVEEKQVEMDAIDKEIQVEEAKADMTDILEKSKVITDEFNAVVEKMEATKKEMYDRAKSVVPAELYEKYEAVKKVKEDLEIELNKIGLKIQQKKDKLIPLVREVMKPHLEVEGDDYDTVRLEEGKIVGTIFNHFDDFKRKFQERKKE